MRKILKTVLFSEWTPSFVALLALLWCLTQVSYNIMPTIGCVLILCVLVPNALWIAQMRKLIAENSLLFRRWREEQRRAEKLTRNLQDALIENHRRGGTRV